MAVSKFKATCLAALERVRATGRPLIVTKRGVPIAQVTPPPVPPVRASAFGSLRGTLVVTGDLVAPVGVEDWDALR